MSYHCSYVVFNVKSGSKKPEFIENTPEDVRTEMIHDFIEKGAVLSYTPEDRYILGWILPMLAELHGITYEHYLDADQIRKLLSTLDKEKVRSLLPDTKEAMVEATAAIQEFIQAVKDGLATGVFDDEDIDISAWAQYAVPVCEAHNIIIYNTLSKTNAEKLIERLDNASLYTAITKAAHIDILGKEEERMIIEVLQNLKLIQQKLSESDDYILLFYDDYVQEYYPQETVKNLVN